MCAVLTVRMQIGLLFWYDISSLGLSKGVDLRRWLVSYSGVTYRLALTVS